MSNLAIIGPLAKVIGFKALGVEVLEAKAPREVAEALDYIVKEKKHKLIFILESLAKEVEDNLEILLEKHPWINVVPIPDQGGKRDYLKAKLKGLVKEAIGTEVSI